MTNLYDLSIVNFKRVLAATIVVLEKGAAHFNEQGMDLNDLVEMKLAPDMRAFPFQINMVMAHTLGAVKGLVVGEFSPPAALPEKTYQGYIDLLSETLAELNTIDADTVTATAGRAMYFRMGELEIPFTSENFVMSFSLPNLYFHAATLYDMLRIKGVPLGKMDFLGQMSVGLPKA